MDEQSHEKRFHRAISALRDPVRVARLEVQRVVDLTLTGMQDVHSVLDVGMGSGLFAEQYTNRGLLVSGVDINPEMLPVAQEYVPDGNFKESPAEKIPFPDASFDLVFMGLLLHETDDPEAAIREAYRVSRHRLAVLEWPYAVQDFGPPLPHRIKEATVKLLGEKAGFMKFTGFPLKNLVLFIMDKKP